VWLKLSKEVDREKSYESQTQFLQWNFVHKFNLLNMLDLEWHSHASLTYSIIDHYETKCMWLQIETVIDGEESMKHRLSF
jgi:hypothetical protein